MPIKSYLAYPMAGQRETLQRDLAGVPGCTVTPSTNSDLMILVTDTPDEAAEHRLEATLRDIGSLESLALVSGYAAPSDTADEGTAS